MAPELPPFKIPFFIKNGNQYRWVERKITDVSDGDRRKWPEADASYTSAAHEFYLCHLGQKWAQQDGIDESGVHYYINSLPSGYAMFETRQPGGPQVYKRLFGHPTGRFYDSAIKFEPHFLWLMSEMDGECECTLCGKKPFIPRPRNTHKIADKPPLHRQRRERHDIDNDSDDGNDEFTPEHSDSLERGTVLRTRQGNRRQQQTGQPYAIDEEGNEDVYKNCIRRLETAQDSSKLTTISLQESGSIDWRAERTTLPQYLTQIEQQHSFIPRIGEMVLWCTRWPNDHHLIPDPNSLEYKFYCFKKNTFHKFPEWRAGVVATVPSSLTKSEALDFPDLLGALEKHSTLSNAGFRIETMADPNQENDKSLEKQYMYVPLRNIRPLSHWQLLLRGIPVDQRHESIAYALTCMTSISLLEKSLFLGKWPDGQIFCKGIYLGPELITTGDTIKILVEQAEATESKLTCTDALVVSSIRYNLQGISREHGLSTTPTLSSRSFITLVGQAFTTDPRRAYNGAGNSHYSSAGIPSKLRSLPLQKVKELFRCVGSNEYGPWYPLHEPHQKLEVSHEKVLGRLYEFDAVRLWSGTLQNPDHAEGLRPKLDFGIDGIHMGRKYATASDERLPEPTQPTEVNWFIADTRAQALALSSLNGLDVATHHGIRDASTLKYWRDAVKVADGQEIHCEMTEESGVVPWDEIKPRRRGRPAGSKVVNGKLVLPGQQQREDGISAIQEEHKSSSQMAGAALASDSDGLDDDSEHSQYDVIPESDSDEEGLRGWSDK